MSSFLKDIFTGHTILGWQLFSIFFHHMEDNIELSLISIDAFEKSSVFLWRYFGFSHPWAYQNSSCLSVCLSIHPSIHSFTCLSIDQSSSEVSLWGLWVCSFFYPYWDLLGFLNQHTTAFISFKKFSDIISSNRISALCFLFPLRVLLELYYILLNPSGLVFLNFYNGKFQQ